VTRLLLAATLALITLVVSSCGGGGSDKQLSKSDYEAQIGAIFRQLQGKTLPTVLAMSPADPERAVRRLESAEKTLHAEATKLAEMKPPADATGPTSELASAFKKIADEVTAARKAAEGGNFLRLEQFKAGVSSDPAVAQVRDAVIQLVNLGYEVAGGGP
jgi:delta 1-pyrroline-5-carboxylate dehydrogenase